MSEYVILTDSACDLTAEMAEELGIGVVPFGVDMEGHTFKSTLRDCEIPVREYYALLRTKHRSTTAAINPVEYVEFFEPYLRQGFDVLYLAFSSGLSSSYDASRVAAAELAEKYPGQKIFCVDTLCASMGQGLLVWLTARQKRHGVTIEAARDYAEANKLHLCHWFTVEDLHHLKRGGRVSATTAILGSALNIKPVLHVDNDGHLISMEKARGRKRSIARLAEKAAETGIDLAKQTVFISHGDCPEEAEALAEQVRGMGVSSVFVNTIGPVIGAHSGPGTMALFFLGSER